ncbi:MAG: hypothetical protein JW864_09235 [Spirochaetes bacterium]|nr:hypothetical protein [Spirochaetota bacterium]
MFSKSVAKHYSLFSGLAAIAAIIILNTAAFSDDLSEADALREKCEQEILLLENFVNKSGGDEEHNELAKGMLLLRLAELKYMQARYQEAIAKYKEYLQLQSDLNDKLTKKIKEKFN